MSDDCKPTCPCKANDSRDAADRAARMIGMDSNSALALLAILSANGWKLVRRDNAR